MVFLCQFLLNLLTAKKENATMASSTGAIRALALCGESCQRIYCIELRAHSQVGPTAAISQLQETVTSPLEGRLAMMGSWFVLQVKNRMEFNVSAMLRAKGYEEFL